MKFVRLAVAALVALGIGSITARAQDESEFQRDTMIQLGDYDRFEIKGPRAARACAEACARDPRCKAWTLVRTVGQCRLKHDPGAAVANACCVSGYKAVAGGGGTGTKAEFCADYAQVAVDSNDANLEKRCGYRGPQWTSEYKLHYGWCLRTDRDLVDEETSFREGEISRCQRTASRGATGICDHYTRLSVVEQQTNEKANCGFTKPPERWSADKALLKRLCEKNPKLLVETEIAARETALSTCFDRVGRSEQACTAYSDDAVKQYQAGVDNSCEFPESRRWSSSKTRHYTWCLSATAEQRDAEAQARRTSVRDCLRQTQQRTACETYSRGAVAQALRAENQRCGLRGLIWSKYSDDHFDYCMQASAADLEDQNTERERGLDSCEADKEVLNTACDAYAKRSVRMNEINEDRECGYRDRQLWSSNYRFHYGFCLQSNLDERQLLMDQRRRNIRQCSNSRGFSIVFDF